MKTGFGWALASAMLLGGIGSAYAADMAVKAPPIAAPVFSWTGFYVGLNAGGDWGSSRTDSPITNTICPVCYVPSVIADINAQRFRTIDGSGFTGGAQAGYNYQVNRFVFGVEADIDAFRVAGSSTSSAFFTGFPGVAGSIPPTYTNSVSTNWLFTGRGRLGFAANNWLFYGTGGVAVTDLSYRHTFAEGVFPGTSSGVETSTASATKVGYAVGGGFEYAWSRNWSVKAEYLYLNFQSVNSRAAVVFPAGLVSGSVFTHSADLTANIVRVGANYHFGAPVVAKY
jgi:outer membrane immunogenic protein